MKMSKSEKMEHKGAVKVWSGRPGVICYDLGKQPKKFHDLESWSKKFHDLVRKKFHDLVRKKVHGLLFLPIPPKYKTMEKKRQNVAFFKKCFFSKNMFSENILNRNPCKSHILDIMDQKSTLCDEPILNNDDPLKKQRYFFFSFS